jgi:hypothetical protein
MNEHLLQTIDSIDDIIEESEMNVCAALYDEYQKMSILLEYADEDVCEEMTIFQEAAAKNEKSDDKGSSKKENFVVAGLKKLGGAISYLFKKLVEKIKSICSWIKDKGVVVSEKFTTLFSSLSSKTAEEDLEYLQKLDHTVNEIGSRIPNFPTTVNELKKDTSKNITQIKEWLKTLEEVEDHLNQDVRSKRKNITTHVKVSKECLKNIKECLKNTLNAYLEYRTKYEGHVNSLENEDKIMNSFRKNIAECSREVKASATSMKTALNEIFKENNVKESYDATDLTYFLKGLILYEFYDQLKHFNISQYLTKHGVKASFTDVTTSSDFKDIKEAIEYATHVPLDKGKFKGDIEKLNNAKKSMSHKNIDLNPNFNQLIIKVDKVDGKCVISKIEFNHDWNKVPATLFRTYEKFEKYHFSFSKSVSDIVSDLKKATKDIVDDFNKPLRINSANMFDTKGLSVIDKLDMTNHYSIFAKNVIDAGAYTDEEKKTILKSYSNDFLTPYYDFLHAMSIWYNSMYIAIRCASARTSKIAYKD